MRSTKHDLYFQLAQSPLPVWTSPAASCPTSCRKATLQNLHCRCFWRSRGRRMRLKKTLVTWHVEWLTPRQFTSPVTARRWTPTPSVTAWPRSGRLRASTRRSQSTSGGPRFWILWRSFPASVTPVPPRGRWRASQHWWRSHVSHFLDCLLQNYLQTHRQQTIIDLQTCNGFVY